MKTSITLDEVLSLDHCERYYDERVRELFGVKTEANVDDIAECDIPDADKIWLFIEICKGFLPTRLGHRKFSTKEKLEEFVKSFGDGDYYSGLRYVEIMLTGGLR